MFLCNRFQGMGIIHTAKKFIIDELYEKLMEREAFLKSRSITELEKARVSLLSFYKLFKFYYFLKIC